MRVIVPVDAFENQRLSRDLASIPPSPAANHTPHERSAWKVSMKAVKRSDLIASRIWVINVK